ncbi:site-specific integrase [Ktedonobacter sp. SOSP1-85]|nr:site-specific integrase [Ktedonobacter sp. SOSP1-85]
MGRKSHYGEGSVFQRSDGRYEATATINGKRRSFYGKTKTEARQKRDEAKRLAARDEYVEPNRQKTGDYFEHWIATHGPTIERSTAQMYAYYIRKHFIPILGHIQLQKLTVDHVQHMFDQLIKEGLQSTTLRLLHRIIKAALNDAVRWERIPKNPARYVKLPKEEEKREKRLLTANEAQRLIATAQDALSEGQQIGAIILLLITTAIRIGEAQGLHWSEVHFEKKEIRIQSTLKYDRKGLGLYETQPKSESSERKIHLSRISLETLSAHHVNQVEMRLQASEWEDNNLVFTTPQGKPTWYNTIRKQMAKFFRSIDLPEDLRPHELRHNVATALLEAGVSMKTVQELLGHSKITTTMDIYGHVTPQMRENAADEIDRKFGKG